MYVYILYSQRLHPTWEKVAEEVEKIEMPVGIGNVDCQAHSDLCREQRVMAFPTLRWYEKKEAQLPDYKSDRTVQAIVSYAQRKLELNDRFKNWNSRDEKGKDKEQYRKMYQVPENPGCQVSGTLHGECSIVSLSFFGMFFFILFSLFEMILFTHG